MLMVSIVPATDTVQKMQNYRTQQGITWTMAVEDAGNSVSTAYGVSAAPWSFIIDTQGWIQKDHTGLVNNATLISEIEALSTNIPSGTGTSVVPPEVLYGGAAIGIAVIVIAALLLLKRQKK